MNSSMNITNYLLSCNLWNIESRYFDDSFSSNNVLLHYMAMGIFISFVILFTILLNSVAIVTIVKSSQLMKKPCYFIILVQSSIDFSTSVMAMPFSLAYIVGTLNTSHNCVVNTFNFIMIVLSYEVSLICYAALTWERYVAILQPYAYTTRVTKRKLMIALSCAYLLDLPISAGFFIFWVKNLINLSIIKLTVFFSLFLYTYTHIYIVVRKLSRQTSSMASSDGNISRTKLFFQQIKLARSCFFAVICFLSFMISPIVVIFALSYTWQSGSVNMHILSSWMFLISFSNSFVNSIIFFWSKTLLRKEALKLLKYY